MNYKNEIGENLNKITKQKFAFLKVVVLMILCAVFVTAINAQEGWKIKDSRTDRFTDTKTVIEEHSVGSRRTSITKFFPATLIQQEEKVLLIDGAVTTVTTKTWNKRGEQLSFDERHFDGYGVLREGKRWVETILLDERGSVVGPKIEQKYNYDTKMWTILKPENDAIETLEPKNNEIGVIEWSYNADRIRLSPENNRLTFYCPLNLNKNKDYQLYGTDIYYWNSSVCLAAVHAGVITFSGGKVTIKYVGAEDIRTQFNEYTNQYPASTRNNITSVRMSQTRNAAWGFTVQ